MLKVVRRKSFDRLVAYYEGDFSGLPWRGWESAGRAIVPRWFRYQLHPILGSPVILPLDRVAFNKAFRITLSGRRGRPPTVLALELVGTAPKGFSIAALAGGYWQFLNWLEEAVVELITFMASLICLRGKGGIWPSQIEGAIFLHGLSRSGDPLLHAHIDLKAITPEGSLNLKPLLRETALLSMIFNHALARRVAGRYQIQISDAEKCRWDVVGVDPALLRAFSKRIAWIRQERRPDESAYSASMRQRRKLIEEDGGAHSYEEARASWQPVLARHPAPELQACTPEPAAALDSTWAVRLFGKQSLLTGWQLRRAGLAATLGSTHTFGDVVQALEDVFSGDELLVKRETHYCCLPALSAEQQIFNSCRRAATWPERGTPNQQGLGATLLTAAAQRRQMVSVYSLDRRSTNATKLVTELSNELAGHMTVGLLEELAFTRVRDDLPVLAVASSTPMWTVAEQFVAKLSPGWPAIILLRGRPSPVSMWSNLAQPVPQSQSRSHWTFPNRRRIRIVEPTGPLGFPPRQLTSPLATGIVQIVTASPELTEAFTEYYLAWQASRRSGAGKFRVARAVAEPSSYDGCLLMASAARRFPKRSLWRVAPWSSRDGKVELWRVDRPEKIRKVTLEIAEFKALLRANLWVADETAALAQDCQVRVDAAKGASVGRLGEWPPDRIVEPALTRKQIVGPACDTLIVLPDVIEGLPHSQLLAQLRHCRARKVILVCRNMPEIGRVLTLKCVSHREPVASPASWSWWNDHFPLPEPAVPQISPPASPARHPKRIDGFPSLS